MIAGWMEWIGSGRGNMWRWKGVPVAVAVMTMRMPHRKIDVLNGRIGDVSHPDVDPLEVRDAKVGEQFREHRRAVDHVPVVEVVVVIEARA